jgi:hypothetical protein
MTQIMTAAESVRANESERTINHLPVLTHRGARRTIVGLIDPCSSSVCDLLTIWFADLFGDLPEGLVGRLF